MSNFINPFDLLEIETTDSDTIKKAKRRKLADIELNDGFLEIGSQKISRSEFIKLVDELDDNKTKNMYFFIKKDTYLSEFLLNNDVRFFYLHQQHQAYQNKDFIDFISPYFAESFNALLLKEFINENTAIIEKLFSIPLLINEANTDKLYKGVSRILNDKIESLRIIKVTDNYLNVSKVEKHIKTIVNVNLLNALPDFFQKKRNDIAMILRNISVDNFNKFQNLYIIEAYEVSQASYDIVFYALKIKIDGATKIRLETTYNTINEINEKKKIYAEDAIRRSAIHKECFERSHKASLEIEKLILTINKITEGVENETVNIHDALENIKVIIDKIYSHSDENKKLVLILKELSLVVFNKTDNIDAAINIITLARKFSADKEILKIIEKTIKSINFLHKNKQINKCHEIILEIEIITKEVDVNFTDVNNISLKIKHLISELNYLSYSFEINRRVILCLKNLSIAVFNKTNNIDTALSIFYLANKLMFSDVDTREIISNSRQSIKDYQVRQKNESVIRKWQEIFNKITDLLGIIDKYSIFVNHNKTIIEQIKVIINTVELKKLSEELRRLPSEYSSVKKQFSFTLQYLAISLYNGVDGFYSFEDTDFATEILKYAQLIHIEQIRKNQQQWREWREIPDKFKANTTAIEPYIPNITRLDERTFNLKQSNVH